MSRVSESTEGGVRHRASGHALFVAAGILLSRIAGLVRERVFAHYFGNSDQAGAFRAALRIPNLLQNLFGEGVLSASFIPVYSKLLASGEEKLARQVAGAVAAFLMTVVSLIVLAGVTLTPWIVDLVAPGFDGEVRLLTIRIVRILFPAIGLLVLSAWCLGILNSHHRFFLSYVAPVVWNVAMIVAMVGFAGFATKSSLVIALAWGTVVGSLLQLTVLLVPVWRSAGPFRFILDRSLEPVRVVFRNMGPVVAGRGVIQISAYLDSIMATWLGAFAVSILGYAQTIYLLPVSLFGMSVAAAELPQMSSVIGTVDEIHAKVRARLDAGLRQISFFVVPSTVALIGIGDILVAALYQTGEFGSDDTRLVWYVLIGSGIGLLASTTGRLFSSVFYAMHDTKTPLKFAFVRVLLSASLAWLFAFPLRPLLIETLGLMGVPIPEAPAARVALGAIGISLGSAIGGWTERTLLRRGLIERLGPLRSEMRFMTGVWGSALVAGVVARVVDVVSGAALVNWLSRAGSLRYPLYAVVIAGLFGATYFALCTLLRIPEASRVLARVGLGRQSRG